MTTLRERLDPTSRSKRPPRTMKRPPYFAKGLAVAGDVILIGRIVVDIDARDPVPLGHSISPRSGGCSPRCCMKLNRAL